MPSTSCSTSGKNPAIEQRVERANWKWFEDKRVSGPNNGGKTFFLKHIYSHVGPNGYLIACNRFSHVDVLNSRNREDNEHVERYRSFIFNFESSHTNSEDNELGTGRAVPKIVPRRGSVVHRELVEKVPSGFEN